MLNTFEKPFVKAVYFRSRKPFCMGHVGAAVSPLLLFQFFPDQFLLKVSAAIVLIVFFILFIPTAMNPVSFTSANFYPMASTNEKQPSRIVIFSQDIINIQGCSPSTASRRLQAVKDHLAKADHQEVTIREYCEYWGLNYLEICQFLKLL